VRAGKLQAYTNLILTGILFHSAAISNAPRKNVLPTNPTDLAGWHGVTLFTTLAPRSALRPLIPKISPTLSRVRVGLIG